MFIIIEGCVYKYGNMARQGVLGLGVWRGNIQEYDLHDVYGELGTNNGVSLLRNQLYREEAGAEC